MRIRLKKIDPICTYRIHQHFEESKKHILKSSIIITDLYAGLK